LRKNRAKRPRRASFFATGEPELADEALRTVAALLEGGNLTAMTILREPV